MAGKNQKYTQEFKQTIVDLYHSGKTYNQIKEEYGISHNALANWIKQYSEVKIDDNTVLTAKQIKELQKRNAQFEEENLILSSVIIQIQSTKIYTISYVLTTRWITEVTAPADTMSEQTLLSRWLCLNFTEWRNSLNRTKNPLPSFLPKRPIKSF